MKIKCQELGDLEDREKGCKMLSSDYDMPIASMISQKHRLPGLVPHKTGSVNVNHEANFLLNCWQLMDSEGDAFLEFSCIPNNFSSSEIWFQGSCHTDSPGSHQCATKRNKKA